MPEFLELTVDKFTFRVATDRLYSPEGMWVKEENGRARVGLSDFFQQRNGDIAFAEIREPGTKLGPGDEIAVVETIKVDISLQAPVTGEIVGVNPFMALEPEKINFDPYGEGWLAVIEPQDWATALANLLAPEAYFERVRQEAEEELGRK
jgi:glycine cleavage system H protein